VILCDIVKYEDSFSICGTDDLFWNQVVSDPVAKGE